MPAFGKTDIEETNEGIDEMVNSVIGLSKFVFWKNGKILFYGNFERPDKNKFAYFSNDTYIKREYNYCSFYGDEIYYDKKAGYSKYSKTYNYSKKYFSFNSKLIPEKRVQ